MFHVCSFLGILFFFEYYYYFTFIISVSLLFYTLMFILFRLFLILCRYAVHSRGVLGLLVNYNTPEETAGFLPWFLNSDLSPPWRLSFVSHDMVWIWVFCTFCTFFCTFFCFYLFYLYLLTYLLLYHHESYKHILTCWVWEKFATHKLIG